MPPVEIESVIFREVVSITKGIETTMNKFQIVHNVLELPFVADAISLTKSTVSPLLDGIESFISPIVETYASPVAGQLEGQIIYLKKQSEFITESFKTNVITIVEQAKVTATGLDKSARDGLDRLTEKASLLKDSSSDLLGNIKETTLSNYGFISEYATSISDFQVVLKLSDIGLSMKTTVLQNTGLYTKLPVGKTINNVRKEANNVRKTDAMHAGTFNSVSTIREASFRGAVAEIFGFNYFLSVVGLQLVPCYTKSYQKVATFDEVTKESLDEQQNADKLADYDNDKQYTLCLLASLVFILLVGFIQT